VVIGNCQGGWAVMMLGASEPAVTGPLVINGAPLSYWAGKRGTNPMRYLGGLVGGVWPALLLSGLGNGKFDGANLVANFESLNPANTLWTKYYNLYSKIDTEASRFLEFERWWGGFYLMNEDEIRWIVDNLFIGNKLAKGRVELDGRTLVDLREIRSPIIVFASSGDNITPPQQALNWIADMYQDVREIKARGQTIVYMVHEDIGHLGIFVSAKIATKEHREIVGTLESIESLPPGLYEMVITERAGAGPEATYRVEFAERSIRDILELDDARADEELFEAVQAVSRVHEGIYDLYVRPQLQAVTTEASGELFRQLHPLRVRRRLYSDFNPLFWGWGMLAESVQAARRPAQPDSPFLRAERAAAAGIESALDLYRDLRDLAYEAAFFSIFGGLRALGLPPMHPVAPEQLPEALLRQEPEVQRALDGVDQGGFAEAVVRMLVLLAQSRGSVRRSRLERSAAYLRSNAPFAGMTPDERARIIRTQTIIVDFEPEKALATLPRLLIDTNDRQRAVDVVKTIAGPAEEMVETTRLMLTELEQVLGLAEPSGPDPVRAVDALPRAHGTASDTTDAAA
jgi:tellurite resistance protein